MMDRRILFVAVLCSVGIYSQAHGQNVSEGLSGADVYQQHCSRCHNFRPPSERSDSEWSIVVARMRSIGNFTGAQSRAVLDFLQSANNPVVETGLSQTEGKSLTGKESFTQQQCVACHSFRGTGGAVGPSLDGLFSRRSVDYVREQLKDPKSKNPASVMPKLGLSDAQINNLINYLRTGQ